MPGVQAEDHPGRLPPGQYGALRSPMPAGTFAGQPWQYGWQVSVG